MQKYEKPLLEFMELKLQDVITLSFGSTGSGNDVENDGWTN